MNTLLPFKLMRPKSERVMEQTQSSTLPCITPSPLCARWVCACLVVIAVAACGGGGSSGNSGASQSSTTRATTTATTVVVTDTNSNALALASMFSKPIDAVVWGQLNSAGADIARSMVPATETVFISTFKTIANPTGGSGMIKVFDAIVASGTLNSSRVFQLSKGTLPSGTTPIWINVIGEDFTKNNPSAESALEISLTDLGGALPIPLP